MCGCMLKVRGATCHASRDPSSANRPRAYLVSADIDPPRVLTLFHDMTYGFYNILLAYIPLSLTATRFSQDIIPGQLVGDDHKGQSLQQPYSARNSQNPEKAMKSAPSISPGGRDTSFFEHLAEHYRGFALTESRVKIGYRQFCAALTHGGANGAC